MNPTTVRPAPMPLPLRRCAFVLLALAPLSCGSEPDTALRVGEVTYTAEQVGRLTAEQRRSLADLTAFGLATSRDEVGSVLEPLAERAAHRARSTHLPWLLAAREVELDAAQLRHAYAAAPEWELTVRHIVRLVASWAPAEEREAARTLAVEARRRAVAGDDFAALAAEYSEEPGAAERGGLLQPGREGAWVDPFWSAALALEPGEISPVVETEYGYHVLWLDDREPVPFEEADRAAVLRRVVAEPQASAAMQRWRAEQGGALRLDRDAVLAARGSIRRGEAPDTLVLARWSTIDGTDPEPYTARDLALFRASLDGEELDRLDRADDDAFVGRVRQDAEEAMWADAARRLGAAASASEATETRLAWEARAVRWAEGLGFGRGTGEAAVHASALRALAAAGQEARITRMELEGLRPLLWERYGVSGDALGSPTASSSSPTPYSASTG